MDFQQLCSFQTFQRFWPHYGYGGNFRDVIEKDFSRIRGTTYLDHAAATLYPESLVQDYCRDITGTVYGNPHSHSPSSSLTHDTLERVRFRILQHFNVTPDQYSVIFTSGSTAALRLVADIFPWRQQTGTTGPSLFCYLTDNHTSVVGMRVPASARGALSLPVRPEDLEEKVQHQADNDCLTPHLFCYPAQSNFSGTKHPLSLVDAIQTRRLYPACRHRGRWFVLLDAASLVGCSALDLQACQPDFVPLSFYKMFGFPTGLGALLVRNQVAEHLEKNYFGGGTAAAYLTGEDYYVPATNLADRFEDGTVSFLDIIALNHGFESLQRITGNMQNVQQHTFGLARYTYLVLSSLRHGNGQPVALVYNKGQFENWTKQGPIINFNLLDASGHVVGYSQVDRMASLYNIHLRTGCFCNTGACQVFLGISDRQMKRNLQAGHVCGDGVDLVDGHPTGSVRVSFGYMSTFEDCQHFLTFIAECFVELPLTLDRDRLEELMVARGGCEEEVEEKEQEQEEEEKEQQQEEEQEEQPAGQTQLDSSSGFYSLTKIYIYPIKSCGAYEVSKWPLSPYGLLYDRCWMVVNGNGVALNQKREPRLCLVRPQVKLESNTLELKAQGMIPISIPLTDAASSLAGRRVCQSKVCGDRVETVDCGDEAASWLQHFLGQPCRLIRQRPDFSREMKKKPAGAAASSSLSLVNEAQFLLVNWASVELLHTLINCRLDGPGDDCLLDTPSLVSRFRANLVIAGEKAFEEDDWTHLVIGGTRFTVTGPCGRCHMVGVDQETGMKSKEPLKTLCVHRKGKVTFGVYLSQDVPASFAAGSMLSVGTAIRPEPR